MRIGPVPLALAALACLPAAADEIGSFSNDWTGNGIVVEAISDPKIEGVTCHLARFDRSLYDRVTKGNWFEDPSNSAIACNRTGPVVIGDIEKDAEGEDVFSERASLIFKSIRVRRIWDERNETLVYVAYSQQVKDASAKMDVSTVPLRGQQVVWK
ncbi:MAG TPA: CreA family protein [Geminicoccaceae bacterium]|nr:CreA family protein [Geminicoccus sp.]HMU53034.1 CreA family protein [Geminicoccaceae bacterium]